MTTLMLALFSLISYTLAQHNHGDMDTDGPMQTASGHGTSYFHFVTGDTLWFQGWVPKSKGAMIGACMGLFLLGIGERWVGSVRALGERAWSGRVQMAISNRLNAHAAGKDHPEPQAAATFRSLISNRFAPPFTLAHDGARAILHMVQLVLGYFFMLAVMTYNVSFIISVVLGQGVGELLFGRFIAGASVH